MQTRMWKGRKKLIHLAAKIYFRSEGRWMEENAENTSIQFSKNCSTSNVVGNDFNRIPFPSLFFSFLPKLGAESLY
jgi:hypothetical protein